MTRNRPLHFSWTILAATATLIVAFVLLALACRRPIDRPENTKASGPNWQKQSSPPEAETTLATTCQRPRVRWELLDFRDKFPSPSRRAIKSVCLVQFKNCLDPLAPNPPIKEEISSDDRLIAARTERGLCYSHRRTLSDLEPQAFALDNVAWGTLRVTATNGELVVFIYRDKFALDFVGDGRSAFWSWTLSRVIDDLYVRKTGKHLGRKMLDALSGESSIHSDEREYAKEVEHLQKIAECTAILTKDRKEARTYMDRASAEVEVFQFDAAIRDYTCAIELLPDDATIWLKRGIVYHLNVDNQRAIADFTKALHLNPKLLDAYSWRSQSFRVIGDNAKADADLKVFDKFEGK
jgi:tetratricopeptide (TPR) repeat protein